MAFAGSPISIILSDDEFEFNTVPRLVSRLWQQLALELSSHSLKERESRGNQLSPGKKTLTDSVFTPKRKLS